MIKLQKPSQRIVSKSEYIKVQGKRVSIGVTGLCLLGTAFLSSLFTLYCFVMLNLGLLGVHPDDPLLMIILSGLSSVLVAWLSGRWGVRLAVQVVRIDPGVPLTHANAANLPAPDTLARASSEPVQAQQTTLLRAAAAGEQTPPEQLVRASSAQE